MSTSYAHRIRPSKATNQRYASKESAKERTAEAVKLAAEKVKELYHGRCIVCLGPGTDVHEIDGRWRGQDTLIDVNERVLLCRKCHSTVHHEGTTKWARRLRELQARLTKEQ